MLYNVIDISRNQPGILSLERQGSQVTTIWTPIFFLTGWHQSSREFFPFLLAWFFFHPSLVQDFYFGGTWIFLSLPFLRVSFFLIFFPCMIFFPTPPFPSLFFNGLSVMKSASLHSATAATYPQCMVWDSLEHTLLQSGLGCRKHCLLFTRSNLEIY